MRNDNTARQNFQEIKIPHGKQSHKRKFSCSENTLQQSYHAAKVLQAEISSSEFSKGEITQKPFNDGNLFPKYNLTFTKKHSTLKCLGCYLSLVRAFCIVQRYSCFSVQQASMHHHCAFNPAQSSFFRSYIFFSLSSTNRQDDYKFPTNLMLLFPNAFPRIRYIFSPLQ